MDVEKFFSNFSMPVQASLYGPPPYIYRGVEDIIIPYEANTDAVKGFLPPELELADDPAVCFAWARWVPFSSFGCYHEAYVMIRVNFGGETFLYQPVIVVDNEVALAAGREIWGYGKKMASFWHGYGENAGVYSEQRLFRVERPQGQPLMMASMACERRAVPEELPAYPVLSCRVIPSAEADRPPSVAELVRLDVSGSLHKGADGMPELYGGRAALQLQGGATDPWHLLAPDRVLPAFFGVFNFDLGYGKVIHNYL